MRLGLALGLLAAALWGLAPVATKGALAGYAPEMINVLRLGVAALVLHGLAGAGTPWLPRDRWSWIGGGALGADFILYNYGLQRTSASVSGLVINVEVVSTIVFAVWLLGERLNLRRVLGSCVTLLGVAFVSSADASFANLAAPEHRLGNVMVMLAGTCWSLFAVAQRLTPRRSTLVRVLAPIFTVSTLTTAPPLLVRSAWENTRGTAPTLMLFALILLCTITVYLVYATSQQLVDVSTLAIVLATIPIFALIFAHFLLSEPLPPRIVVSGAVILLGVLTIATERPDRQAVDFVALARPPRTHRDGRTTKAPGKQKTLPNPLGATPRNPLGRLAIAETLSLAAVLAPPPRKISPPPNRSMSRHARRAREKKKARALKGRPRPPPKSPGAEPRLRSVSHALVSGVRDR